MNGPAKRALLSVSIILGFMLSLEAHIDRTSTTVDYGSYFSASEQLTAAINQTPILSSTLLRQQKQLKALEAATHHTTSGMASLRAEVADMNQAAGLTSLTGTGLSLRIDYDPALPLIRGLHYVNEATQIQMVLNLLDASGAQAIAINGQRLVTTSSIRSVEGLAVSSGPFSGIIQVNGVPVQAPYVIAAIGPTKAMVNMLNVEGMADQFMILDQSFMLTKKPSLTLPPYTGVLPGHFSTEVGM